MWLELLARIQNDSLPTQWIAGETVRIDKWICDPWNFFFFLQLGHILPKSFAENSSLFPYLDPL